MATLTTADAALSRRLRERDRSAWEELYVAYGPRLRAFALRLTRDPHEADDLVQETFVRALPSLERSDGDEVSLRPYLFTTLRNTFLRRCERGRRVAPVEEVPEPQAPAAIEDDPERNLLLRGQIEEVRAASESLAPRQRLALALRELEGCSYAEIGAIVGLNDNAVAQLISRARESLRSTLRLAQVDAAELPEECRLLLPQLSRHLDGQLRGEQLERVLNHVEGCERCLDSLQSMREASRRYRVLVPPLLLADEAHAAAIDAELTAIGFWQPRRPRWRDRSARRAALVAVGALLLVGGGALVRAGGSEHADRTADARSPHATAHVADAARPAVAAAPQPVSRTTALPPSAPAAGDGTGRTQSRAGRGSVQPRRQAAARPAPGRRAGDALGRTAAASRPASRRRATDRLVGKPPAVAPPTSGDHARSLAPAGAGAAPTAPAPEPIPGADTTPPAAKIRAVSTRGDSAAFAFTASQKAAGFACALDAGSFEPCTSPKTYEGLAPGGHTFRVRASDADGNVGAADSHGWRIAEPLPDLVITSLGDNAFTVANAGSAPVGPFVVAVSFVGSFTFAGLAPGAEATRTWPCRRGAVTVFADRANSVAESDETNNRRSGDSAC